MAVLDPIKPNVKAMRIIPQVDAQLKSAYGLADNHASAGLITCDLDDALYTALDEATKHAPVDVTFARSFYAGSGHASGPTSGEILGVIGGADPEDVRRGLNACLAYLERDAFFYSANNDGSHGFFPHVISSLGHYLSKEAGLAVGEPMAYLIATPLESVFAVDAALKAADTKLVKAFTPPTETNFGGAFLTGSLESCEAAAQAFAEAVVAVSQSPSQL